MTRYLPVQGTNGWVDAGPRCWWRETSPFAVAMAALGCALYQPGDPWVWSTELNGWQFWRRWSWLRRDPDEDHRSWRAGAKALRWYLDGATVNLVCHSHGGNVWAYAAGQEGVRFGRVVLVGTPIRADLRALYEQAVCNSEAVLFVTDADDDATQRYGRFGDGAIGDNPLPPTVMRFPVIGIGHSRLLQEPQKSLAALAFIAAFLRSSEQPQSSSEVNR